MSILLKGKLDEEEETEACRSNPLRRCTRTVTAKKQSEQNKKENKKFQREKQRVSKRKTNQPVSKQAFQEKNTEFHRRTQSTPSVFHVFNPVLLFDLWGGDTYRRVYPNPMLQILPNATFQNLTLGRKYPTK